ncbi:MAG: MBL fold metallo-hydrolase, partial [Bacteroidales bacterium]|nr:MBL fold metallo-hydrolase [Bacteroidales bacterium]
MRKTFLLLIMTASAGTWSMAQNEKNSFTYKTGSAEIILLSEGQQQGKTSVLIGATSEMLEKYVPDGVFPNAVNAFLVRQSGKTILVDAGFGTQLFDHLQRLGVSPEQIDAVLLTHMHGDHIGGMLREGKTAFPNAAVYISQAEHDYWTSDKEMNRLAENRHGGFLNARKVISAYKDRLHLFLPNEAGKEASGLIAGISAIAAYGHTPGHTAFLVSSDGNRLLIWGDLTHAMAVQMPYPNVAVTYDVNPEQAVITRQRLLEYITQEAIPVAGMHIAYPATGKIWKSGEGYFFEPCIDKEAVEQAIRRQLTKYPEARLQDIYKNCFQDYFGPEHLLKDTVAADRYLQQELALCSPCTGNWIEPAGWEGNFCRVDLCILKENKIAYQDFLNAFIASANQTTPPPLSAWKDTWQEILSIIDDMHL